MPKTTYRLTVSIPSIGSLYRSFASKEPALLMHAKLIALGYTCRIELVVVDRVAV